MLVTCAREISGRPTQSLQDGTDRARSRETLHQLVRDVSSVERRKHEHICIATNASAGRLAKRDLRNQRRITLQFSVHCESRCAGANQVERGEDSLDALASSAPVSTE